MNTNHKIRELIANIAALPMRTRSARRRTRDKIRFRGLVAETGNTGPEMEKFPERINVAFCFDDDGYKLAAVSIRSLISASGDACDYDIYCVVDDTVSAQHRKTITRQIRSTGSRVFFLNANNDFNNSYRAGWPVAIYYRTMLPKLIPNVNKIIYADIDVIFCRALVDAWRINMGNNLLAGVRDYNNGYINSGFLIMNLKQMRTEKIYEKWITVSRAKKYKNPDQDLLNYTARGRIVFLPLKYNFQPMLGPWIFKAHSANEIHDLRYNLVAIHYSNWMKPWHAANLRPIFSHIWWHVATQTGLY